VCSGDLLRYSSEESLLVSGTSQIGRALAQMQRFLQPLCTKGTPGSTEFAQALSFHGWSAFRQIQIGEWIKNKRRQTSSPQKTQTSEKRCLPPTEQRRTYARKPKQSDKQTNKLRANLLESKTTETKSLAMFSTSGTWKLDCRNSSSRTDKKTKLWSYFRGPIWGQICARFVAKTSVRKLSLQESRRK
jgi:hypothetical protein